MYANETLIREELSWLLFPLLEKKTNGLSEDIFSLIAYWTSLPTSDFFFLSFRKHCLVEVGKIKLGPEFYFYFLHLSVCL